MRVNLLVNPKRTDAVAAAIATASDLRARGAEVKADVEAAPALSLESVTDAEFPCADLIITFGGDGTLIRAAHLCSELGTPILGVYYGRFGFVTQCQGVEVESFLDAWFAGKTRIEERMMIQTELIRNGQVVTTLHSLNEMVLQREVTVRMLTFEVCVDDQLLTRYPADGVLIASPTGSTGYNLSVNGPIVDPRVKAMVLTAISPHTLSARPLILSPDSTVEISVQSEGDAVLSADGQKRLHLLSGDKVRACRSPRITRLVLFKPDDFLQKVGERMFWSRRLEGSN